MRFALVAMLLVACERDRPKPAAVIDTTPAAVVAPGTTPAACPTTGKWSDCAVIERLDRAGLAPRVDTSGATEPPLGPRGTLVRVGTSALELYIYPDASSREREQAKLDRTKYLDYATPQSMREQPTLIFSANLIAILHSRNDHQRERVADAITAGPPQPSRP